MPSSAEISLRPMLPDDGPILAAIFAASIDELTQDDYSPSQQAAWIASAESETAFGTRLLALVTIVAIVDGEIEGFGSLKAPDTLEMLYVRPAANRQGVGTALCEAIERIARGRGAPALNVAASDTAQSFFARRGYEALHRETVPVGDEWLGRTAMRKALDAAAAETQH